MTSNTQGGVGNEETVDLGDLGRSDPDGRVRIEDPADPLAAVPCAEPGPIFVTIIDPGNAKSVTFGIPFGFAYTIAHTGSLTVTDAPSPFPTAIRDSMSPSGSSPVQASEAGEPNLRDLSGEAGE